MDCHGDERGRKDSVSFIPPSSWRGLPAASMVDSKGDEPNGVDLEKFERCRALLQRGPLGMQATSAGSRRQCSMPPSYDDSCGDRGYGDRGQEGQRLLLSSRKLGMGVTITVCASRIPASPFGSPAHES